RDMCGHDPEITGRRRSCDSTAAVSDAREGRGGSAVTALTGAEFGLSGRVPRLGDTPGYPVPQRPRLDLDLPAERRQLIVSELPCPVLRRPPQRIRRVRDPLGA